MPLDPPARADDLPFIVGLIAEDSRRLHIRFGADPMGEDYRKALAAIDADPSQEMFVVDRDGEPVGCFQLSYIPGLTRRRTCGAARSSWSMSPRVSAASASHP